MGFERLALLAPGELKSMALSSIKILLRDCSPIRHSNCCGIHSLSDITGAYEQIFGKAARSDRPDNKSQFCTRVIQVPFYSCAVFANP